MLPPTQSPTRIGRYQIEEVLGTGGMGTVYKAVDTRLQSIVAIKVPHTQNMTGPDLEKFVARMHREARAAAALPHHDNLCPIRDFDEVDGQYFIVMPYMDGKPLSKYRLPMEIPKALATVRTIARAMQVAHEHGIVHRDLKPDNIMIVHSRPVIMDFGLAKWFEGEQSKFTTAGRAFGTPAYMPPEQVEGKHDLVNPQSDIYSLGVILWQLLTGDIPYRGTLMDIFRQILVGPFAEPPSTSNPEVSPAIDTVCMRAMSREMADRFRSMAEFAESIDALLAGQQFDSTLMVASEETDPVHKEGSTALFLDTNDIRTSGQAPQPEVDAPTVKRKAKRKRHSASAVGPILLLICVVIFAGLLVMSRLQQAPMQQAVVARNPPQPESGIESEDDAGGARAVIEDDTQSDNNITTMAETNQGFGPSSRESAEKSTAKPANDSSKKADIGSETNTDSLSQANSSPPTQSSYSSGEIQKSAKTGMSVSTEDAQAFVLEERHKSTRPRGRRPSLTNDDESQQKDSMNSVSPPVVSIDNDSSGFPRTLEKFSTEMNDREVNKSEIDGPLEKVKIDLPDDDDAEVMSIGKKAGEHRVFADDLLPMRWCPPGKFTMGNQAPVVTLKGPGQDFKDEQPVEVTLSHGFWMGQTEITISQWSSIMRTEPWKDSRVFSRYLDAAGEDSPVHNATWEETKLFCETLTRRERAFRRIPNDWSYSLPTEAQWEYACRAGTESMYNFGVDDSDMKEHVWFAHNSLGGIHNVASKKPNAWGLYDMHGNVSEWCLDLKVDQLPGGLDPLVTNGAVSAVHRGGSWNDEAVDCRSAARDRAAIWYRGEQIGFRVVLQPVRESTERERRKGGRSSPKQPANVFEKLENTDSSPKVPLGMFGPPGAGSFDIGPIGNGDLKKPVEGKMEIGFDVGPIGNSDSKVTQEGALKLPGQKGTGEFPAVNQNFEGMFPTGPSTDVADAKSRERSAMHEMDAARDKFERAKKLHDLNALSSRELDRAELELLQSELHYQSLLNPNNPRLVKELEQKRIEMLDADFQRLKLLNQKGAAADTEVQKAELELSAARLKFAKSSGDGKLAQTMATRIYELRQSELLRMKRLHAAGATTAANLEKAEKLAEQARQEMDELSAEPDSKREFFPAS